MARTTSDELGVAFTDHERCTGLGHCQRGGSANAGPASGHDAYLVCERRHIGDSCRLLFVLANSEASALALLDKDTGKPGEVAK